MIYFPVSQRPGENDDWFALRRGVPTASRFDQILTPKTERPSSSQKKLMAELISELLSLIPPEGVENHTNRAMRWGTQCEAEARRWYEMQFGVVVDNGGFCMTEDGRFGASPDFLVGLDITNAEPYDRIVGDQIYKGWKGATCLKAGELKCPQGPTHAEYLLDQELPSEYRCQVQGHMLVTGCQAVDFLSYSPGMAPLCLTAGPEPFGLKLWEELEAFYLRFRIALGKIRGDSSGQQPQS